MSLVGCCCVGLRAACSFRGSLLGLARCLLRFSSWPVLFVRVRLSSAGVWLTSQCVLHLGSNPAPRGVGFLPLCKWRCVLGLWLVWGFGVLVWRLRLGSLRSVSSRHGVSGLCSCWVGAQLGAALAGLLAGRLFGWLGPLAGMETFMLTCTVTAQMPGMGNRYQHTPRSRVWATGCVCRHGLGTTC